MTLFYGDTQINEIGGENKVYFGNNLIYQRTAALTRSWSKHGPDIILANVVQNCDSMSILNDEVYCVARLPSAGGGTEPGSNILRLNSTTNTWEHFDGLQVPGAGASSNIRTECLAVTDNAIYTGRRSLAQDIQIIIQIYRNGVWESGINLNLSLRGFSVYRDHLYATLGGNTTVWRAPLTDLSNWTQYTDIPLFDSSNLPQYTFGGSVNNDSLTGLVVNDNGVHVSLFTNARIYSYPRSQFGSGIDWDYDTYIAPPTMVEDRIVYPFAGNETEADLLLWENMAQFSNGDFAVLDITGPDEILRYG